MCAPDSPVPVFDPADGPVADGLAMPEIAAARLLVTGAARYDEMLAGRTGSV
jgi:hypothetical protein